MGIAEGHVDPAVALVRDGRVIAFSEEERHIRRKHAFGCYPIEALKSCLSHAGIGIEEVAGVGVNWDLAAYSGSHMRTFFAQMRASWPVDERTVEWQEGLLRRYDAQAFERRHRYHWRRAFGDTRFPSVRGLGHHAVHAFQACRQSPLERSVCLTLDGSGDEHCTVVWRHEREQIDALRALVMPHSLGWFYAGLTEYLGFAAYDGEPKVMALAGYGRSNAVLRERVERVLHVAPDGIEYRLDPTYLHYGEHTWSERFTDALPELFGAPPRLAHEPLTAWHEDLARAVQEALEAAVIRLARWALATTGFHSLCLGGGVALNIQLSRRLLSLPEVDDVFAHPLCSDSGAAAGAALLLASEVEGCAPEPLRTLALGPEETDAEAEAVLQQAGVPYQRPADLVGTVAEALADGRIAGWFQGRAEAGPRALGQRSIIADPRRSDVGDRISRIVKQREWWRPYCPSLPVEAADRYFDVLTDARYMIVALPVTAALRRDAPAVVHVDGTARPQFVHRDVNPRFHSLLNAFGDRTGVPVLLNTSFNAKGDAIVGSVRDALQMFWSSALDVLVVGGLVVRKPGASD